MVNEEKRAEALDFLNRWAHDGGAKAVSFLEGKVSAVVLYPGGVRHLITAEPCPCGQIGCEGWKVKHEGAFRTKPEVVETEPARR